MLLLTLNGKILTNGGIVGLSSSEPIKAPANSEIYYIFDELEKTILGYDIVAGGASAYIPSKINGVEVEHIGEYAFAGAKNGPYLTSLIMTDGILSIGAGAFSGNQLSEIIIPNTVMEIGNNAFASNSLVSAILPSGLEIIPPGMFYKNSLAEILIPESVIEIGSGSFVDNNLTSIALENNIVLVGAYAFSGNDITTITIKADVVIEHDEMYPTLGTYGNEFEEIYNANPVAGTYNYTNGAWVKDYSFWRTKRRLVSGAMRIWLELFSSDNSALRTYGLGAALAGSTSVCYGAFDSSASNLLFVNNWSNSVPSAENFISQSCKMVKFSPLTNEIVSTETREIEVLKLDEGIHSFNFFPVQDFVGYSVQTDMGNYEYKVFGSDGSLLWTGGMLDLPSPNTTKLNFTVLRHGVNGDIVPAWVGGTGIYFIVGGALVYYDVASPVFGACLVPADQASYSDGETVIVTQNSLQFFDYRTNTIVGSEDLLESISATEPFAIKVDELGVLYNDIYNLSTESVRSVVWIGTEASEVSRGI